MQLGEMALSQFKMEKAYRIFKKCLFLAEQQLGKESSVSSEDDPIMNTCLAYFHLGEVLNYKGDFEEAYQVINVCLWDLYAWQL